MVVITLAGDSKRFFNKNYNMVKYKLPYNGSNIISQILKYIPKDESLVVVLNKKFNDFSFIEEILKKNFSNFQILEIENTRGQLETLYFSLNKISFDKEDKLIVYNGDTIRKDKNWENFPGDGCIEVFSGEGNHWSYIDNLKQVKKVAEKKRISNYCSSGLYYFRTIKLFLENYQSYKSNKDELFISEYYNHLIDLGYKIKGKKIDIRKLVFLGTPEEYEKNTSEK